MPKPDVVSLTGEYRRPPFLQSAAAAIFEDRNAMGFDVAWFQSGVAAPASKTYLACFSDMLKAKTFLFGE